MPHPPARDFEIDPDDVQAYLESMDRRQSLGKAMVGGFIGVFLALLSDGALLCWAKQNSVYFLPVLLIPAMTVRISGRGWGLSYRLVGALFTGIAVFLGHILSGSLEAVAYQPDKLLPYLQKMQPETLTNLFKLQQAWYIPWLDGVMLFMGAILSGHSPTQGDFESTFHTDFTDKMDREIMMELSRKDDEQEKSW